MSYAKIREKREIKEEGVIVCYNHFIFNFILFFSDFSKIFLKFCNKDKMKMRITFKHAFPNFLEENACSYSHLGI